MPDADGVNVAAPLLELAVERHIAASPQRVWQIMTERLADWFCPRPWTTTIDRLEWRAGGPCAFTLRGPNEGEAHATDGVVLEFIPGRRFVFTDALNDRWEPQRPFMVGVFEIRPDGDGTHYRASARHWSEEEMERHHAMGFNDGWTTVANQLAALAEAN